MTSTTSTFLVSLLLAIAAMVVCTGLGVAAQSFSTLHFELETTQYPSIDMGLYFITRGWDPDISTDPTPLMNDRVRFVTNSTACPTTASAYDTATQPQALAPLDVDTVGKTAEFFVVASTATQGFVAGTSYDLCYWLSATSTAVRATRVSSTNVVVNMTMLPAVYTNLAIAPLTTPSAGMGPLTATLSETAASPRPFNLGYTSPILLACGDASLASTDCSDYDTATRLCANASLALTAVQQVALQFTTRQAATTSLAWYAPTRLAVLGAATVRHQERHPRRHHHDRRR
jgi:hypothetical protein